MLDFKTLKWWLFLTSGCYSEVILPSSDRESERHLLCQSLCSNWFAPCVKGLMKLTQNVMPSLIDGKTSFKFSNPFIEAPQFFFQIDLTVLDKNDNAPAFVFDEELSDLLSSNQYLVSVQDNTPIGSPIIQIQVKHSQTNLSFQFELSSMSTIPLFRAGLRL